MVRRGHLLLRPTEPVISSALSVFCLNLICAVSPFTFGLEFLPNCSTCKIISGWTTCDNWIGQVRRPSHAFIRNGGPTSRCYRDNLYKDNVKMAPLPRSGMQVDLGRFLEKEEVESCNISRTSRRSGLVRDFRISMRDSFTYLPLRYKRRYSR